ncbi:unnamed protein product [Ilex paraguariensis]|uniref:Uncharacterized protein n=1 Tax=Ilex paraguariensis TaxID=185542 RepID=A0ABC8QUK8_9AQUA
MGFLRWPKPSSTTNSTTSSVAETNSPPNCCCLSKLLRKLKKHKRMLRSTSRQASFQCRYDPLSYSLNFDTGGCGSFLDEDYYQFCAFSSRFVATPRQEMTVQA